MSDRLLTDCWTVGIILGRCFPMLILGIVQLNTWSALLGVDVSRADRFRP